MGGGRGGDCLLLLVPQAFMHPSYLQKENAPLPPPPPTFLLLASHAFVSPLCLQKSKWLTVLLEQNS